MLVNKKSQAIVIDLIILVILVSALFMYLSHQTNEQSISAESIRAQNSYTQMLLTATLKYNTAGNATIAELIEMNYCGHSTNSKINESVNYIMKKLNKQDYYFIFTACADGNCGINPSAICSKEIIDKYGGCCVKTERINIASYNLTLPSSCNHRNVVVSLGVWPKSMGVKKC